MIPLPWIPFHVVNKMLKTNRTDNNNVRVWPASVYINKLSFVEKCVWGSDWFSETTIFKFDLKLTVLHVHYIHRYTPWVILLLTERWLYDLFFRFRSLILKTTGGHIYFYVLIVLWFRQSVFVWGVPRTIRWKEYVQGKSTSKVGWSDLNV